MPPSTASRRSPQRPDFNNYHSPPDGDYVRYIDTLLAWAEQEQARQGIAANLGSSTTLSPPAKASRSKPASRTPATRTGLPSATRTAPKRSPPKKKPSKIVWGLVALAALLVAIFPLTLPLAMLLWVLWHAWRIKQAVR